LLFSRIGLGEHRLVLVLDHRFEGSDKPIAATRQRLDEAWVRGRISQSLAQFICGRTQSVIEIDESVFGPQRAPEFLPRNDLSPLLQ
jgi:hypothetical protein